MTTGNKTVSTQDLAAGMRPGGAWPDDLPEIIYIDRYGNAVTGLRASEIPRLRTYKLRWP